MKNVSLVLCAVLLGAVVVASAQTSPAVSDPPDIVVVQKNWRPIVHNSLLDADPFSANAEFNEALRAQRDNDIRNAIRARGSESREPPPPRRKKGEALPSTPTATYVYQVKLRNTGTKTIRAVDWGYIFTDPETQQEVGRHRYSNKVKIRPGQNNGMVGRTSSPPTYIVNVKNVGKEPGKKLSEQVVIYRVEYEDGTVWQNPSK
ncbi:MAG TPA: hypothetical protein VF527_09785 [Pyrinomonadaceae bacterium]|jgi:hypothetical protein